MSATRLILIRHAHIDVSDRLCGWFDVPLSAHGHYQLNHLRKRLRPDPTPDAIFTSTSTRARETATVAADLFGMNPILSAELREISCGIVDGSRLSDLQRTDPDLLKRNLQQNDDRFRWPGGESYREFRNRILRGVRFIAARYRGGRIVAFTHAGVISQIIGFLNGTNSAKWESFRPGYASITELIWHARGPELIRFDDQYVSLDQQIPCSQLAPPLLAL